MNHHCLIGQVINMILDECIYFMHKFSYLKTYSISSTTLLCSTHSFESHWLVDFFSSTWGNKRFSSKEWEYNPHLPLIKWPCTHCLLFFLLTFSLILVSVVYYITKLCYVVGAVVLCVFRLSIVLWAIGDCQFWDQKRIFLAVLIWQSRVFMGEIHVLL